MIGNCKSQTHEPFKWSLIRWEDQVVISNITLMGPPSFKVNLTQLITSWVFTCAQPLTLEKPIAITQGIIIADIGAVKQ